MTLGSIPGGSKICLFSPRIPDQHCNTLRHSRRFLLKLIGKGKGKGKVHPRTGNEGPEGEQIYSSTLPLTWMIDGVSGQRHALAALYPRERPGTHCIRG